MKHHYPCCLGGDQCTCDDADEHLDAQEEDAKRESNWCPLWSHMQEAHGLTLTDDECHQISMASDESRMKSGTPVAMILINALRSLGTE